MKASGGTVRVEDIMSRSVITVTRDTGFQELVSTMSNHQVSGVPVVEGGRLVGIVTEADLLREGAGDRRRTPALEWFLHPGRTQEAHKRGHSAGDIMTAPVVTVRPQASIWEAIRTLRRAGVKRLPVVDEEDRVVGILSRPDLLNAFNLSDEQIKARIQAIVRRVLVTDPRAVDVKVDEGHVWLQGSVDHEAQRDVLLDLVSQIPGVLDLEHDVQVASEGVGGVPFAPIQPPGKGAGPRPDL